MIPTAVIVLADVAGTIDATNRVEMRARHTADVQPAASWDLVDTPSLRLGLRGHTWDGTVGYSAITSVPDLQAQIAPTVFQIADVGVGWHSRRVRLGLSEGLSYGATNPGQLLAAPTAPAGTGPATGTTGPAGPTTPPTTSPGGAQALPQPVTLFSGSSTTTFSAQLQASRRWFLGSSLAYSMAGGLDTASRVSLAFVRGPRADGIASFSLTRLDSLDFRVNALRGDTTSSACSPSIHGIEAGATCAPRAEAAQASASWRRQLTRATQGWAGAGVSATRIRLKSEDPYTDKVYPVALAGMLHEHEALGVRTTVRLDATIAPILDVRTGILDQRATGTLSLTLPFRKITVTGTFGATRSITSPFVDPLKLLMTTAEVDYRVSRILSLGVGGRYTWQEQGNLGAFSGGAAFAQATLRAPQVKF